MTTTTHQLIATLSRDVSRVGRYALMKRLVLGITGGAFITTVFLTNTLGTRPDLGEAIHGFSFWFKISYTMSLGLISTYAVARLAQPLPAHPGRLWLLAVPVLVLAGIAIGELAHTPNAEWLAMWLGRSWKQCPWVVLMLACPIFVGLIWSFRKLAPTRLRAAGAIAGLCAGAWSATIYCLHCPEVSGIFVLTWYTLGMLLAALIGALAGPPLLRW